MYSANLRNFVKPTCANRTKRQTRLLCSLLFQGYMYPVRFAKIDVTGWETARPSSFSQRHARLLGSFMGTGNLQKRPLVAKIALRFAKSDVTGWKMARPSFFLQSQTHLLCSFMDTETCEKRPLVAKKQHDKQKKGNRSKIWPRKFLVD